MKTICLTGTIASGKSTAVAYLKGKGAFVIDADRLGHRVYNPGTEAFDAVVRTFGEDVCGDHGEIDRKLLGGKVFGKPEALKRLTDIVWPEIRKLVERQVRDERVKDPGRVIVLEAAVLLEAGWQDMGDQVWVLLVDREIAIRRAMERDKLARDAVEQRLASQLSDEERIALADFVIENNGDLATFRERLDDAWASAVRRQESGPKGRLPQQPQG